MNRLAYFDCFSGISGDMVLGALVDAGLSTEHLREELAKLDLSGYRIEQEETTRGGLRATKVSVTLDEARQPHRGLGDIRALIASSLLHEDDKERAIAIFERLAAAEGKVHGRPPNEVMFHEVGAVDAIVDIVGAVCGLRRLGIEHVYCSPIATGRGWAKSSHGAIPVPGPATLELLANAGAQLNAGNEIEAELVTPTGAAIVATLATFEQPAMVVRTVGYGAGSRELEHRPNVLRLWLGETPPEHEGAMTLIETNIDDMSPELLGYAQERLFAAGAVDVWFMPIQMKKNRPAVLLSAICPATLQDAVIGTVLRETTTLGVRSRPIARHEAHREILHFTSSLGEVSVKVKRLPGGAPVVAPEFEVCAAIARERGLTLADVYRIVQNEAEAQLTS